MKSTDSAYTPLSPFAKGGSGRLAALVATLASLIGLSAQAQQNVLVRPVHPKLYVGSGFTGSYTNNQIRGTVSGGTDPVNYSFTGAPAGVSVALLPPFDTNNFVGSITIQYGVDVTPTLAKGVYPITIVASNTVTTATTNSSFQIIAGHLFTATGSDTNWSTAANWSTGTSPGAGDNVMFQDASANTNVVTGSVTVGSLTYIRNVSGQNHNTILSPGVTLSVVGTNGFRESVDALVGGGKTIALNIIGTNASLVVSNSDASFSLAAVNGGGSGTSINMSGLDNFRAEVNRFGLGDVTITNGGGVGNQIVGTCTLAKTNIIKTSFVAGSYSGVDVTTAITFFNNDNDFNNGSANTVNLGSSNAFFADSIRVSAARVGSGNNTVRHPTAGGATNVTYIRNVGGGRVSLFAVAFDDGEPNSTANSQGQFDMRNGSLDLLADTVWLGRYRSNSLASGTSARGTIHFQNGIVDVNNLFLGYQAYTNEAFVQGTLNIVGAGAFVVNDQIDMAYYTGSTNLTTPPGTTSGGGTINISSNGTLRVKNIRAGGPAKYSLFRNAINLSHVGRLVLTNTMGTADAWIHTLSLVNGSSLTLHGVTVGQTNLFVGTFTTALSGGTVNRINIPVLNGVTTYPVTIPVIAYTNATSIGANSLEAGTLPSGVVVSSIVDDTVNKVVNFTFTTNQPKAIVWRGNIDNTWDTVTKNWITLVGGLQTNYTDGDSVIFEDNAPGLKTINIAGTLSPGQIAAPFGILVSNTTPYTFASGTIVGNGTLKKVGTSSLTVDATLSSGVILSQGALLGSGTVGATVAEYNSDLTGYLGTINNGLTVSNALVNISGTVSGGLTMLAGSLTNNGTINGSVNLQPGIYLTNANQMNVTVPWALTNSTLVNNGTIVQSGTLGGNGGLTVQSGGVLKGTGKITIPSGGSTTKSDGRVTIGNGGTLMIGNAANEISSIEIATRLDLIAGSTTIFDVDTSSTNDVIFLREPAVALGHVNFGAGNSLGGTLLINKIGGPAFTPGTVLSLFDRNGLLNEPENLSPAIPSVTPAPLPGYTWDVSQTITNLLIPVTTPLIYTNVVSDGTNLVFSWPASYRGWRLERQTNSLAVGLEPGGTNWVSVFTSLGGTNAVYYPDTNDYSIFYFRTVQQIVQTNPAVFYRMVYP